MNLLWYERELWAIEHSFHVNPRSLLHPEKTQDLRTLLAGYSTSLFFSSDLDAALSDYQGALALEQAELRDGLEIKASFVGLAAEYEASIFEGLHDDIQVTPESPDPLRAFLAKHIALHQERTRCHQQLTSKRAILKRYNSLFTSVNEPVALGMQSSKNLRLYPGRGSRVDSIARVIFGLCGAVSFVGSAGRAYIYHKQLLSSSWTTLFVLAFVLLIALLSDANNQELVAAAAAAAVLVVFVGTTAGSS